MRAISLDLVLAPQRPWGRACLAAGGFALTGALALQSYLSTEDTNLQEQEQALSAQVHVRPMRPAIDSGVDEAQRKRYQAAATELAIPWEAMFRALETTRAEAQSKGRTDPVSMHAIEPDARAGTVLLSGEVRRLEDAASYLRRLGDKPPLTDVFMVSHRESSSQPEGAVRFVIEARWRKP
jgi:hypothetical protein